MDIFCSPHTNKHNINWPTVFSLTTNCWTKIYDWRVKESDYLLFRLNCRVIIQSTIGKLVICEKYISLIKLWQKENVIQSRGTWSERDLTRIQKLKFLQFFSGYHINFIWHHYFWETSFFHFYQTISYFEFSKTFGQSHERILCNSRNSFNFSNLLFLANLLVWVEDGNIFHIPTHKATNMRHVLYVV